MNTDIRPRTASSPFRLDGRVALITGASRGIGKATAIALTRAGADVALIARDGARLAEVEVELSTLSDASVRSYPTNAGVVSEIEATVAAVMEDFGRIDVLVNNVATNPYYGPMTGLDMPPAEKTVQVNVLAPIAWIQQVWQASMEEHGGTIVNMASIGPFIVEPGAGLYAASKAALVQLTRQFAAELGPGVRVNAVAPGLIKTDMSRVLWEGREEHIAAKLPLGRLGTPSDVAGAVWFLVSDVSAWVTGQTLVVDGGTLVTTPAGLDR